MKRTMILLILALGLVAGCGYQVPGAGDRWVGQDGRTLYVELFANRAKEPYLENYLTEEVTRRFAVSRLTELTEDRAQADLVLSGTVLAFDSTAASYTSADRISEFRASMDVSARLVRRTTGEVLWQGTLRRAESFRASADKNQQIEAQTEAARLIAKRLAEDLYARLLTGF